MTYTQNILDACALDEQVTNEQLVERTGYDLKRIATHVARLRDRGLLERTDESQPRHVVHRLAGAARIRAEILARAQVSTPFCEDDGSIIGNAKRTPKSVFDLARCSCSR